MKSFQIVGYTYDVAVLCPSCTINAVSGNSTAAVEFEHSGEAIESWLRTTAVERGIDYDDEKSYDSGDFPKVIFADQVERGERCDECEEALVDDHEMYWVADLLVDGALEESETFYDETDLDRWIEREFVPAEFDSLAEVFVQKHDHPPLKRDEECACVQYEVGSEPYWSNGKFEDN